MFRSDNSDTVQSATVEVNPTTVPPLNATVEVSDNTTVKLWVDGGEDGTTYTVEVKVTSAVGRVKEDEIEVEIQEID